MKEEKEDDYRDIREAQEYLTINKDGEKQLIVGIDYLSENHSRQEIVRFLKEYREGMEKILKELVAKDKSNTRIDEVVAVMFRMHMAISLIEQRMEVNNIVRIKQRTTKSSHIRKRDRRSHRSSRVGEDENDDGADRETRHRTRSAA